MRGVVYKPPRFNLNRFCHRLVGLLHPEARLAATIVIPQAVIVPDTSTYEGTLNMDVLAASGASGVIAKASQGNWIDDQLHNTWSGARGRLPRGCYHFFDPRYSPTVQRNTYLTLVQGDPGELPLVVDWEATWAGSYSSWSNLYAFLEGLKANMPGHPIMIYTGYYYWLDHSPNPITQPQSLAYFGQYGLWLAWYAAASVVRIPRPWTDLKFWQYTDSGPGPAYGTQSGAIDLNYYNGTQAQFDAEFGAVPPPGPEAYVVRRSLAETDILITPSVSDILPLKTPFAQMQEYGWDAAMNCGAGFVYTDATHAQINTTGFQSVQLGNATAYYARKMITAGVINPDLDTAYLAPWSMLGYAGPDVCLIVTRGQEGLDGMTQAQAAQWALARGITELYLFDSGHSSAIAENGMELYSAYGEAVPQCIGFKARITGGTIMKGVAKANTFTNIKSMTAGVANWKDQLVGGGVVYGTPAYDLTGKLTDLTNFDHYYLSDGGTRVELGGLYKVSAGNLVVSNTPEPTPPPPPPPAPPPAVTLTIPSLTVAVTLPDGSVNTFAAQNITLTKQ